MSKIIQEIETAQLRKNITDFKVGDTVIVQIKVKEGTRERLQTFEGVVIARRNRGLNSSFTVRKISHGEGVERVFQTHSPLIASITVKRQGDVRKAKLYYLRDLSGRAARIKEKIMPKKIKKGNTIPEPLIEEIEQPEMKEIVEGSEKIEQIEVEKSEVASETTAE